MEARRRALGRGLGALISPERSPTAATDTSIAEAPRPVALESISPSRFQPRETFDDETIEQLAESIKQQGVLQPLLVRHAPGGYELIAGERRFRAAKLAGLHAVPVLLHDVGDREALELAIVENVQREDLNAVDEARAYQRLATEFGLTQEDIALRVGKTRAAVSNSLRLLQLDPLILRQVESGELTAGHARSLLSLPESEDRAKAAREIVSRKLNVRDAERFVRERAKRVQDADRAALEASLSRALGTKVRIRTRSGTRGRIEIDFYNLDQFDGLVVRLSSPDGRAAASF